MGSLAIRLPRRLEIRNALVRLFGWRALVWQQDPAAWDRFRWVESRLLPGPLRTLDAGSGSGAFTMLAASRGHDAIGMSIDQRANARASARAAMLRVRRARFRTEDLRELPRLAGELGRFDQILCLETIEHVQNDAKLVADLAALLRPGGTLLLTTPTATHRRLIGERLSESEDGGHVRWGYSIEGLRVLFHHAGLRIASETWLSGIITQQLTNFTRIVARLVGERAAWAITLPLRVLQVFDRPLTRLVRYPWLAVGVVAVKP